MSRQPGSFDEVADELYGLPPSEFTAARNRAAEQAKRDGERESAQRIKALRRPTAVAHALNLLVRAHPEQVDQLRELGKGLRDAQEQLQGTRLRDLAAQRTALVSALAAQARREAAEAGQPVGEQAADELDQTLRAVLADEDAVEEFAAGRLAHALTPGSTLPDLPTGPPRRAPTRPPTAGKAERDRAAERERRLADAELELRRLEAEQRSADTLLERARTQAERAADQRRASRERVQRAERALAEAREAVEAAEHAAATSGEELAAAERRAGEVRGKLEEQQVTVDRLRRN